METIELCGGWGAYVRVEGKTFGCVEIYYGNKNSTEKEETILDLTYENAITLATAILMAAEKGKG